MANAPSALEHPWWPLIVWTAGLAMGAHALSDNSFLTHLATGRIILASGPPHRDLFTFTSGGSPIVVQSWLASWCYASLEALAGGGAIRMFVALLTGVLLTTVWRLSRPAGSILGRLALTTAAGVAGLSWWNERPQLLAFTALGLIALVLGERRSPWWLVPLFAVWVNVHGSFPLGMVFVGVTLGVRVVETRRIESYDLTAVVAMIAGVVGGALIGPYGSDLLTFPLHLLGRPSLHLIVEWGPLHLDRFGNLVFAAEAAAIVALLAYRRCWARLLAAALFAAMAVLAVRNVAIAALVLVPLAAPALAGLGTQHSCRPPGLRLTAALAAVAVALTAVVIAYTADYDLHAYPTAAVGWMHDQGYAGRPDRNNLAVLTHDYCGSYMEWLYGPGVNVWIDDRFELHPFETIRDYVDLLVGHGDPDALLSRYPHDLVLWKADSPLARHLAEDQAYRILYRDASAIVACRKGGRAC